MAEVQLPYSVDRFNAVPDLADARDAFAAKDGPVFFDNVFVPLIQKHGVDDKIGLCLLHRHFGLDGTEKLVEFNNVSLPWQDNGSETPMTVGGHILPSSWLIQDDKVMPYEFFFSAPGKEKTSLDLAIPENRAFVNEFVQAVKDADLAGCVGLRVCPEGDFDDTLEIQQGRANVNFSKGQVSGDRERIV